MSTIEVKGFVNQAKTVTGGRGNFSAFSLSEGQKQKDGTYKKVYYDCVDFNSPNPPENGTQVVLKGYFSVKDYQKRDGGAGVALNINVQNLEVAAPPKDRGTQAVQADPTKAFDDIPF